MTDFVSCPNCNQPVNPRAHTCNHCGATLGVAAVFAERAFTTTPQEPPGVHLSPEVLVPRLGEYLIEKGMLNQEELQKALEYQQKMADSGQTRLIGQTLLELGFVDRETLDQVVTEQILQLQSALQRANRELEERVRERTSELERALNRLSELSQLKSNFVANVSHELRTPLTHIKGYMELMTDGGLGPLNPQQKEAFRVMQKSEERLERLIEDLIQFSAAYRGDLNLDLGPVSIPEIIGIVREQVIQRCKVKGLTLMVEAPRSLPLVRGDRQKLFWVISHLIDNAIKFTPEGGRVRVGGSEKASGVVVYVSDTGIGIASERLDEIFEPFHQLDGSSKRRYGGTGLGLSLAQRIIEAHGSTIKVCSKLEIGSHFEFSLPVDTT
jgi:signal transduction histidine kinase